MPLIEDLFVQGALALFPTPIAMMTTPKRS